MKTFLRLALVFTAWMIAPADLVAQKAASSKFKCLIQMTNYTGEGAYIVISLIDGKGAYEKTLYVLGPDKKWYNTVKDWHQFYSKKSTDISAITGASVTGGDRSVSVIEVENSKINSGYKLRFESAVEDKEYFATDVEIPLTTETLAGKAEGKGYIRYVRLSAN